MISFFFIVAQICIYCVAFLAIFVSGEYLLYHWLGNRNIYRKFLYGKTRTFDVIPIFGVAPWLVRPNSEILSFFHALFLWRKQINEIVDLRMPFRRYIVPIKPDIIEKVLGSMKLADKGFEYKFLSPWLKEGLLLSKGKKWTTRRKMLTGAFHFKILEQFIDIFNEQSAVLVNKVEKYKGKEFELVHDISLCTLDIICQTAMGIQLNVQVEQGSSYIQAVYRITKIIMARMIRPYLYPDILFHMSPLGWKHRHSIKILHDFTTQVVKERREEFYNHKKESVEYESADNADKEDVYFLTGKKRRLAFLDLLIEASDHGRLLTDEDIREEVDTFMFEGHDTTAMAIAWTIYLLGCYPECQAKVHAELDEVFGDSDRPATADDLTKLKYLEMCIKESLRLYPSVPAITRDIKEFTVLDDYEIKRNNSILVVPYLIHRNADIFPKPERFIPERFSADNSQGRHPYAYIPFSAGPRNCIGQRFAMIEEKIVTSTFLRRFNVTPVTKRDEIHFLMDLILRPQGGMKIKVTQRK